MYKTPKIRWNNLKFRIKDILDPNLNLEIQQKYMHKRTAHPKGFKNWGNDDFTLDFVTVKLNGKNIWWFPKDSKIQVRINPYDSVSFKKGGDWIPENVKLQIIRYLDIPKDELLIHDYSWDYSGITEILRVSDKRIGYKRLLEVVDTYIPAAKTIFEERFKNKG